MNIPSRKWFDGARQVLFVHAHPDDETITTGGTLAALAEFGRLAGVLTLTRGEQGEVMPGVQVPEDPTGDERNGLASLRTTELANALLELGITQPQRHAFLGSELARVHGHDSRTYQDSGMQWHPDGHAVAADAVGSGALAHAAFEDALEDALAFARLLSSVTTVDAVVSYDENGGYGHPDHIFAHTLARAIAHSLSIPFWIITTDGRAGAEEFDISAWLPRKIAALRAHASQLVLHGNSFEFTGGQVHPVTTSEWFMMFADYTERHSSKGVS